MPRPSNWAILHRTLVRQAGPQSIPRPHPCPDLNGSRVVMLLGHLCPTGYTSIAFQCHEGAAVTRISCPTRCGVPWPQPIYSKGTDKHLTKYPYAKYAPGSEEFTDLYLEAYQLPFDQRSTLQREVVHLGMRRACPPPIGMWAQTNFQKFLKENGPPVESRVRRLADGAMQSDDLSVWMFLRDCAGGNAKSRQVFIKTALELLSSGEYHKLVDNSQPAGCWSPRPYGREVSRERADRAFAQHLWACGVDEANYVSVFRPYAFAVHLHTECPDGGTFEFGYVLMDERREVALAANHPDTGNVSKKRKQQDAVPSMRPEQQRRAWPAAVAAPPQLAPAVKLPQLNLASHEHDVLSDDELSTSGSSDEGGPFAVSRPEARPPVDHSMLCEPDEPLDYGGNSPLGPVIH